MKGPGKNPTTSPITRPITRTPDKVPDASRDITLPANPNTPTHSNTLSHTDATGKARMVNVSSKAVTVRTASAAGRVQLSRAAYDAIITNTSVKGDVLGVARIAGVLAAKRCDELIPLCHTLPLTGIELTLHPVCTPRACAVEIGATVTTAAQTGVEMEALVAVSVAALTVIDMIKAIDRGAIVQDVRITAKSGGKSGDWTRDSSGELVALPGSASANGSARTRKPNRAQRRP